MKQIDTALKVEKSDELKKRKALYKQAVKKLEPREIEILTACLLYTSPSPRDISGSRMPSSA